MLWVLKRNVSMSDSFKHPKHLNWWIRKYPLFYAVFFKLNLCVWKIIQWVCTNFMVRKEFWGSLNRFSVQKVIWQLCIYGTGPRSAVGNVSGYRCESDCRSRGRKFDPGPVPYFRGVWSWNNFYGHSPLFCWIIQEGLLSVTSKSMCTKYWLTACSSLPRKKCG